MVVFGVPESRAGTPRRRRLSSQTPQDQYRSGAQSTGPGLSQTGRHRQRGNPKPGEDEGNARRQGQEHQDEGHQHGMPGRAARRPRTASMEFLEPRDASPYSPEREEPGEEEF